MSNLPSARAAGIALALAIAGIAAAAHRAGAESQRQSPGDAWWTGPLLTAGAGTVPRGHVLIEPYLFDSIVVGQYDRSGARTSASREHRAGSQSYLLYGLTDRVTVGLLPRFGFYGGGAMPSSSRASIGDLGAMIQIGLTRFEDDRWIPATALLLSETVPTGRYDQLGDRPGDGLGAGVYTTSIGLHSQYLFWLPTGRILRARLNLSYARSSAASVRDVSVYGTADGFRGSAHPGRSLAASAAWEYSITRHWGVALDVAYEHSGNTRVDGRSAPVDPPGNELGGAAAIQLDSGASDALSIAPAIEYNFTAQVGVIVGVKLMLAGWNARDTVVPVTAINLVL
jgi:hypothetical protein